MSILTSCFIRCMILLVISGFLFDSSSTLIYSGYSLSKLHIVFVAIFSIIISVKYCILGKIVEGKGKKKFISCIILILGIVIAVNLVYKLVPNYISLNNWYVSEYKGADNQFVDFMFLPKYYDSLNVLYMTLFETVFSLALIGISYFREKLQTGNIAYILERIQKRLFRYNILVVFLINLLTIPNKFLLVKSWKFVGVGIAFLVLVIAIVRSYLMIRVCKNKNDEKYGKENLILVITPTNFTFTLSDDIINPLHKFYRYDNKNLVKSLLVSGKKYTFALYDVIRYKLINIDEYENVSYLIVVNEDILQENESFQKFSKKIDDIAKITDKFMMYKFGSFIFKPTFLENMKSKYPYKVKEKIDLKDVIDMTTLEESADKLKMKAGKLLKYIQSKELNNYIEIEKSNGNISNEEIASKKIELERLINVIPEDKKEKQKIGNKLKSINQEKNTYLKYGLELILDSFNYIEYFYTLLKMSEYVIHYMGLKSILEEENISQAQEESLRMSTWRAFVKFDKEYLASNKEKIDGVVSQSDVIDAIIKFRGIIKSSVKNIDNEEIVSIKNTDKKYYFRDICKIVSDIRNRLLVHGTISLEMAKESVNDLFSILFILVREFEELNITIEDDEKIKNVFEKDISAVYRYSNKLFLYSNPVMSDKKLMYNECLNYETGKKKVIDAKAEIDIGTIYPIEQIKTELGRWM